jgi:hypothetical protein
MDIRDPQQEIKNMFTKSTSRIGDFCKVYLTQSKGKLRSVEEYCYGIIKDVLLKKANDGSLIGISYIVDPIDGRIDESKVRKIISKGVKFTSKPNRLKRAIVELKQPIDFSILNEIEARRGSTDGLKRLV